MARKLINTIVKIGLGVILNGIIEDYSDDYIKLENGLMFQWGRNSGTMSGGAVNITHFPNFLEAPYVTMLTNVYQNKANLVWSTGERRSNYTRVFARVGNTDDEYNGGYQVGWFSIGKWK